MLLLGSLLQLQLFHRRILLPVIAGMVFNFHGPVVRGYRTFALTQQMLYDDKHAVGFLTTYFV